MGRGASVWLALLLLARPPSTFSNGFSAGLNPTCWTLISKVALYTVTLTNSELRFSKPTGGSYTLQYIGAGWLWEAVGNFDARVEFRDASITRHQRTHER